MNNALFYDNEYGNLDNYWNQISVSYITMVTGKNPHTLWKIPPQKLVEYKTIIQEVINIWDQKPVSPLLR